DHRWRIHTLARGHRTAGRARLQQFRQSDHVRAARSDSCLRHRAQRGARRVRAGASPALVPIMSARARVLDYALLVVGLWLAWVLVFRWAGPEALSPPGATLQRMGEYLTSAQTARVLRLAPVETPRTVLLPAALPEIVTGLRIGFSATLLGTLIGELFASDQGLGFMLIRAMEAHKVLDIIALTLLLFAFAAIANALLLVVQRRVH